MNTKRTTLVLAVLLSLVTPWTASAVTIDTVPIGNPGNAGDTAVMNDGTTGYGSVPYSYRVGTTEVTVGQYTAFLNAVAATDTYALYNPSMATDLNIAGIVRSGPLGSYTYSVIGSANHPVTYANWGDAARFSNWMNNGQPGLGGPSVPENAASTEGGAYTLNGAVTNAALNTVTRNASAKWFIPSENEWYKAAYYDSKAGHYWQYPTRTDATPTSAPPGNNPNTANYYNGITGYAMTGSTSYVSSQNYLTDVGAYTTSPSPYGTFDQGGGVWEWNEALALGGGSYRGLRGGAWTDIYSVPLQSIARDSNLLSSFPTGESSNIGFRVATLAAVPEPSAFVLAAFGFVGLGAWRWKRRRGRGVLWTLNTRNKGEISMASFAKALASVAMGLAGHGGEVVRDYQYRCDALRTQCL